MDIVKRLRRYRPTYGWPEERSVIVEPTLNHVAADEIEQLRDELKFTDEVRQSALQSLFAAEKEIERLRGASIYKPHEAEDLCEKASDEIERLRHEFRELHKDISMFMDDGPLKQDLLETIADVLGEEK